MNSHYTDMSLRVLLITIGLCFILDSVITEIVLSSGVVTVEISQGKLSGLTLKSREAKEYFAFRGIPYASVPKRFEAPGAPPKWKDVRDATKFGPVCPQVDVVTHRTVGEEDCLTLNVYSPKLDGKYPVVVFIHGGGYQYGSGSAYGGSYFTDENTVLVTVNYRLNSLGFLSTGDNVIQGNMGLKDQNSALKWVQKNIQAFGGDNTRVTLQGTSAGAASVSLHVLSPMSKGLFHRAITISGSALNPWTMHSHPALAAQELAENLDCPKEPSAALAECLKAVDFRKLVRVNTHRWFKDPTCEYAPVIEEPRKGQNPAELFLTEEPMELLSEGRFNKVPVITGVMEDEGLLFHSAVIMKTPELLRNINEDWNKVIPISMLYDRTPNANEEDLDDISRTIRGFYFGQRRVDEDSFSNLTNLYSDRYFNHGIKQAALLQAKYTPTYPFILGFHGEWSILNLYYGATFSEPLGVSHGDDMQYFFDSTRFPKMRRNSKSEEFSKAIVKLWAYFARTGNVMESLGTPGVPWMPISPEEIKRKKIKWFNLDLPPKVLVREPFTERLEFWDKINAQITAIRNGQIPKKDINVSLKEEL